MSESDTPTAETVTPTEWSRPFANWPTLRVISHYVTGLAFVAAIISQLVIWVIWEPVFGDSLKYLITYSMSLLLIFWGLGWWFVFAPVSWRTANTVGIPMLIVVLAFFGSIRRLDMSGDMRAAIEFRWQPTREQRLAAHREQMQSTPVEDLGEVPAITPEDMPGYRGIQRDGVVIGPKLTQDWEANPPEQLWRQPIGGGYAQFAVVGSLLVTIEQRGENEAIVCYDAKTGAERWVYDYPAAFVEAMGGPGPRTTPTIDGDAVFVAGALGDIHCLSLLSGMKRWQVNVIKEYGLINTDWAMSSSPLVIGTKVIVNPGGPNGNGLVALHRDTGAVIWATEGILDIKGTPERNRPGYSSPTLVELFGVEQILNLDGTALRGHDPDTGEQLWSFPYENDAGVNAAQPILLPDGKIFLSASYNLGSTLVQLAYEEGKWSTSELWNSLDLRGKFSTAHLIDGYIYGVDEGIMVCLDPKTGERMWKGSREGLRGRYGHGQQLFTNGQLVILTESGDLVLMNPNPDHLEEVTHFKVLPDGKVWNPPALVGGRAYVRNAQEMAAFDLRAESTPAATNDEVVSTAD
ncbi:MAG: PQQ-binding-like beta-propeller repeat protein [Planctomycetaceae bacterium]|nr:PQQ-binding-like beta-propeller repeat protein [Planctomycetaceae bacterium]